MQKIKKAYSIHEHYIQYMYMYECVYVLQGMGLQGGEVLHMCMVLD